MSAIEREDPQSQPTDENPELEELIWLQETREDRLAEARRMR
ncbi:hypothetical protein ACOZFM_01430 [Streptomyces arboris]